MLSITEKLIEMTFVRPRRPLKKLKGIVIHWTANQNKGAGAAAHARYFNNLRPGGRQASAHYMVDDKEVIQLIPDLEVAFHVGSRNGYTQLAHQELLEGAGDSPNNYLIGIELCVNEDSDLAVTRQKGAILTRDLLYKYGLTVNQVYRHFDITGKNCPQVI